MQTGFRFKLLGTLMASVLLVTAAAIVVTQHQIAGVYETLLEKQFALQATSLRQIREARLAPAQARCLSLANSVRLRSLLRRVAAASESGDAEDLAGASARIYQTAEDELRELLGTGAAADSRVLFFRLTGAKGNLLPPPKGVDAGFIRVAEAAALQTNLNRVLPAIRDPQAHGCIPLDNVRTNFTVAEVLFTGIHEADGSEPLGGLVLGFAMPELDARPAGRDGLPLGLALEGRFFSQSIPREDFLRTGWMPGKSNSSKEALVGGDPSRLFSVPVEASSAFPQAFIIGAVSWSEALAQQAATRSMLLASGALGLALVLPLALLIAHTLAVPVQELAHAAGEVGRGNLETKVKVRTRDELGELATRFNEMTAGLALKERYRNMLNLVADKAVAEEMVSGRIALGGEKRPISVLFCDIRGFTALTEHMEPHDVVEMLNEHMTCMTKVVYEHHGVVDKFVGDLIMAIFGAPTSHGNDALNAVRCAMSMIEERARLNGVSNHHIEMGIGVASGEALAGCMGSADRLNYTVLGARVNLASRLCSKAGRMELIIDEPTKSRVTEEFQMETLDPLTLKGFAGPVPAFKVLKG